MATQQSNAILRAKWLRGWELMRAGKSSEGYDLLAGVKLSDLAAVSDAERPERAFTRVQAIIERQPRGEVDGDGTMMDALIRAAKRGDHEANELLIFGDLE
jgi:hypothetical protein